MPRSSWILFSLALLPVGLLAQEGARPCVPAPLPIDFARIERRIDKLPELGADALYGLYLFGYQGQTRVWAVLDKSDRKGVAYDVLYLDKNANGDLTEPGERFAGKPQKLAGKFEGSREFAIGDYAPPGADATHKDWKLTWTRDLGVRFRMLWRGEKVTFGGYGPTHETYAPFADSIAKAPVFVPGWDRPFQFERWGSEPLKRGESHDFEVFVGNQGDRTGAFSAVDDAFVPVADSPVATLIWRDDAGKEHRTKWELKERC